MKRHLTYSILETHECQELSIFMIDSVLMLRSIGFIHLEFHACHITRIALFIIQAYFPLLKFHYIRKK